MANPEHLEILNQGVEIWNKWRKENPEVEPDLSNAILRDAKLSGADLRDADLRGADLSDGNLRGADLRRANLRRADLHRANLVEANLSDGNLIYADLGGAILIEANLGEAYLSNANLGDADLSDGTLSRADLSDGNLSRAILCRADLRRADLSRADLSGAILRDATLAYTTFANVDLSEVIGLETCTHQGPSTISIDTIYKSQGKIPEEFLRDCGVDENFIRFIPSLVGSVQPFQLYSCFISYSTKDDEFAKRLHSRLRDAKARVWFSPEDVKGGEKLFDQLERAIQLHDRLLLILSEESLKSGWVETEIRKAIETEKREGRRKLFPIRIMDFETIKKWRCFDADTGKDLAVEVREYFIPDFSDWKDHDSFEAAFDRLLRDLKAEEQLPESKL